jgi:hypothetical protein
VADGLTIPGEAQALELIFGGELVGINATSLKDRLQACLEETPLCGAEVIHRANHEALRKVILWPSLVEQTLIDQVSKDIEIVHMKLPIPSAVVLAEHNSSIQGFVRYVAGRHFGLLNVSPE